MNRKQYIYHMKSPRCWGWRNKLGWNSPFWWCG